MDKQDILKGLNSQQALAVQATQGPVLVTAGAGSGKTRVLTRRIAYLVASGVKPSQIVAITFTRKAADEMRERTSRLVGWQNASFMHITTFHGLCLDILHADGDRLYGLNHTFSIADDDDQQREIRWVVIDKLKQDSHDYGRKQFRMLSNMIGACKDELLRPSDMREIMARHSLEWQQDYPDVAQIFQQVYPLYQQRLKTDNLLDFNDLIMDVVLGFRKNPKILEKYQDRWQYLSVDEYQDTNIAQYQLIRELSSKYQNIFAVGDPDQSIYGWRGADIHNILDFKNDFKQARVIKLEQNYRSTKEILHNANKMVAYNVARMDKNLWTQNQKGQPITICEAGTPYDEQSWVAEKIAYLHDKLHVAYKDIAIMYRSNWLAKGFSQSLSRFSIPYKVVAGQDLYQEAIVKNLLSYWNLMTNPASSPDFRRVINYPRRGVGARTIDRLVDDADQNSRTVMASALHAGEISSLQGDKAKTLHGFAKHIENLYKFAVSHRGINGLGQLFKLMNSWLDFTSWKDETKSAEEVNQDLNSVWQNLVDFVKGHAELQTATLFREIRSFMENLQLTSQQDQVSDDADYVQLMSIHAAKGLEFENVFVVRLNNNVLPNSHADSQAAVEEERRLFYVAMTRAKKRLYLSFVDGATGYGGFDNGQGSASMFLDELDKNTLKHVKNHQPSYY